MANQKLENVGNVGNVRICFPSFFLPSFRFWVFRQNQKVGREKAGKFFSTILRFPSFQLGLFLLALRLSARKSEIKKTLMMSTGTYIKMLYVRSNISEKRIPNMRFWIIYNLDQTLPPPASPSPKKLPTTL